MKEPKIYERHWLNMEEAKGGTGFVWMDEEELKFADCGRVVTLDFDSYDSSSEKHLVNLEYKIDTIYEAVKRYRAFVKKKNKWVRKMREESEEH